MIPSARALLCLTAFCWGFLGLRAADAPDDRFVFAALGCMPYSRSGGSEAGFGRIIAEINHQHPVFTVHLGDILGSDEHCTDELMLRRRDQFNTFESALVYTPGDNEWTDTHFPKAGGYDPLERLAKIRQLFFAEERSLGRAPIPLVTQRRDPKFAKFVENARWVHGGVMFVTVHVVGSHNNRQPNVKGAVEEWRERDAAVDAWLRDSFAEATKNRAPGIAIFFQADPFASDKDRAGYDDGFERFLTSLEKESRAFAKPVLIVHADEHRYRLDVGLRFERDAAPAPNVTRLETFGAANMHGVLVVVDPGSTPVFLTAPLIVPGNPLPVLPRPKAVTAKKQ